MGRIFLFLGCWFLDGNGNHARFFIPIGNVDFDTQDLAITLHGGRGELFVDFSFGDIKHVPLGSGIENMLIGGEVTDCEAIPYEAFSLNQIAKAGRAD